MRIGRVSLAALLLVSAACGDDGGGIHVIDGGNVDSGPKVCSTALSLGTPDFSSENKTTGYISWGAPVVGTLTGGPALDMTIEFYPAMPASGIGPGAIDLASPENSNYDTCRVCILAFDQAGTHTYFQKSGTVTLTEDPLSTRHLKATVTNLVVEEVSIDQMSHSTPIPTGECATIPDKTFDEDRIPNAWTCPLTDWDSGGSCNCLCGNGMTMDPDCLTPANTVTNCSTAGQACFQDTCVAKPANDTCTSATPLTLGTAVNGTTVGADHNYDMGLETATCTGYAQKGGDVAYSITLAAGTAYTVSLTNTDPDWDGSISLVGPGTDAVCSAAITACVKGADDTEYDSETFSYTPTAAGTYYVIVDGYYQYEGGTFTLTVTSP